MRIIEKMIERNAEVDITGKEVEFVHILENMEMK
jgi:hypothetical protein